MVIASSGDPALAAFGSSLTAITLAELGDKTFFMALILAARHRPRWVFIGAFAALACVTLISLALGFGLRELLPKGLVPWLAAGLFLAFGIKLLLFADMPGEIFQSTKCSCKFRMIIALCSRRECCQICA